MEGLLSIESKNIFMILKKWLYTKQDIVFRELISNAADAIEKRAALANGPYAGEINVIVNQETKQLVIRDNGIGMSFDEVDQYINKIAFSGAEDFISQNSQADNSTIIGHFGVGFYSSFMLADYVEIETKSCKKDAEAVKWGCNADMAYTMEQCEKADAGTDVILQLGDDDSYIRKPELVFDIVKDYFRFSRTPIYINATGFSHVRANEPDPIWKKSKESIKADEMNAFYRGFFHDDADPLFWIQFASMDIGVRGAIFFRNTKNGADELDGTVKVYSRGVYVGENIPELVPRFVNLQSGIIECGSLPLVVSRSSVMESESRDDNSALIRECLSQEVSIAMHELFTDRRSEYERLWPEIGAFVKYGAMQDKIFASVMTRKIIFLDLRGVYHTIQEHSALEGKDGTVFYASDLLDQAHYIEIFKKCGLNALLFDHVIDQPLLYRYESLFPKIKFVRIDSNIESVFQGAKKQGDDLLVEKLARIVESSLGGRLEHFALKFSRLAHQGVSAIIINDESSRRIVDMLEIYGYLNSADHASKTIQSRKELLFNLNNPMVKDIFELDDKASIDLAINQLFDLALLSQQSLAPEELERFISRSESVLAMMVEKSKPLN
jgi:molecular chaperone HtpG